MHPIISYRRTSITASSKLQLSTLATLAQMSIPTTGIGPTGGVSSPQSETLTKKRADIWFYGICDSSLSFLQGLAFSFPQHWLRTPTSLLHLMKFVFQWRSIPQAGSSDGYTTVFALTLLLWSRQTSQNVHSGNMIEDCVGSSGYKIFPDSSIQKSRTIEKSTPQWGRDDYDDMRNGYDGCNG